MWSSNLEEHLRFFLTQKRIGDFPLSSIEVAIIEQRLLAEREISVGELAKALNLGLSEILEIEASLRDRIFALLVELGVWEQAE